MPCTRKAIFLLISSYTHPVSEDYSVSHILLKGRSLRELCSLLFYVAGQSGGFRSVLAISCLSFSFIFTTCVNSGEGEIEAGPIL